MRANGTLRHDTVAVTTMTNLGFHLAMRDAGIRVVTTDVGDRYVLEALGACGLALGGEQSGHVIFADHASTGDGMLTAVVARRHRGPFGPVARRTRRAAMTSLPQVLVNVTVAERCPTPPRSSPTTWPAERELGDEGRVLVRASGTEPLVRVMVEAPTAEMASGRRRPRRHRPPVTLGRPDGPRR